MQEKSDSLVGKVALITGAAQRIGAVLARTLHAEGMNIVVHYHRSQRAARRLQTDLNEQRANSAIMVQADLLDEDKLPSLIQEAHTAWGRLDALVNNASSFYPTEVGKVTAEQWGEMLGTNLKAPFFLAQAAAPHLRQSGGCIVNITDIHAERPLKGHAVYSIAKAGLVMLTRSLACELAPQVRVNAVAPGAIMWPERSLDEVTKQRIISRTFLKRRGDPADIARAVLFFLRDAPYVTGQVLSVDGGRSLNS